MSKMITGVFDIVSYVLIGISSLSILVAFMMIMTMVYINIIERRKEIGILKAIGYRDRDIKHIFILEIMFVSFVSFIIALVLEYLCVSLFDEFIYNALKQSIIIMSFGTIIFGLLFTVLIYYLASYFPSLKITKVDPIISLKS